MAALETFYCDGCGEQHAIAFRAACCSGWQPVFHDDDDDDDDDIFRRREECVDICGNCCSCWWTPGPVDMPRVQDDDIPF